MSREDRIFWRKVLFASWLFWLTVGVSIGRLM